MWHRAGCSISVEGLCCNVVIHILWFSDEVRMEKASSERKFVKDFAWIFQSQLDTQWPFLLKSYMLALWNYGTCIQVQNIQMQNSSEPLKLELVTNGSSGMSILVLHNSTRFWNLLYHKMMAWLFLSLD